MPHTGQLQSATSQSSAPAYHSFARSSAASSPSSFRQTATIATPPTHAQILAISQPPAHKGNKPSSSAKIWTRTSTCIQSMSSLEIALVTVLLAVSKLLLRCPLCKKLKLAILSVRDDWLLSLRIIHDICILLRPFLSSLRAKHFFSYYFHDCIFMVYHFLFIFLVHILGTGLFWVDNWILNVLH